MHKKKTACITFLGNINYDTRSHNLFSTLEKEGIDVSVISFEWLSKDFNSQTGKISVYKLDKSKSSILFYTKFIFYLIRFLIKHKADYYYAEDVYTLPFVVLFAKFKGGKVYYDSRELYGFLAGLKKKPTIQKILQFIERISIRHVDWVLSTGPMDSEFLMKQYGIKNIVLLRNLPMYNKDFNKVDLHERFNLPHGKIVLLYQGVVLRGRGLSQVFNFLKKTEKFVLLILGDGDHRNEFEGFAANPELEGKIVFGGKFEQGELLSFTSSADIGIALIENLSLSYYYALPNKLFEYIMAEIPVIVSNFPQMKQIIDEYKVGYAINPDSPEELSHALSEFETEYLQLKENCRAASQSLNWENEVQVLLQTLEQG